MIWDKRFDRIDKYNSVQYFGITYKIREMEDNIEVRKMKATLYRKYGPIIPYSKKLKMHVVEIYSREM